MARAAVAVRDIDVSVIVEPVHALCRVTAGLLPRRDALRLVCRAMVLAIGAVRSVWKLLLVVGESFPLVCKALYRVSGPLLSVSKSLRPASKLLLVVCEPYPSVNETAPPRE